MALDLEEAIARYGPDAFRYFLLREIPFDADGSFTWERFDERYTADLANAFGNLASRTMAMIERYCDGEVPATGSPVMEADQSDLDAYARAMEDQLLHEALQALWGLVSRSNEYVDRSAPWKLAKDPERRAELEEVLGTLARRLALQSVLVAPFMPGKARELWSQLGAPGEPQEVRWPRRPAPVASWLPNAAGWRVTKGAGLFPKEREEVGRTR